MCGFISEPGVIQPTVATIPTFPAGAKASRHVIRTPPHLVSNGFVNTQTYTRVSRHQESSEQRGYRIVWPMSIASTTETCPLFDQCLTISPELATRTGSQAPEPIRLTPEKTIRSSVRRRPEEIAVVHRLKPTLCLSLSLSESLPDITVDVCPPLTADPSLQRSAPVSA